MIQQFLGFHGFSFDAQVTGVAIASGVPSVTAALGHATSARRSCRAGIAPGCRSSRQPEGGRRTESPTLCCIEPTVARRSWSLRHREHHRGHQREREYLGGDLPRYRDLHGRARGRGGGSVELVPPKNVIGKTTVESIQSGRCRPAVRWARRGPLRGLELGTQSLRWSGRAHHPRSPGRSSTTSPGHAMGLRIVFERNRS
jgi:hypothetical protein